MNFLPISAIFFRHLRFMLNYLNKLLFTFYWPFLDVLLWGFLGKYMQDLQGSNNNLEVILLLSILLWACFARLGMEIFNALIEELWTQNVINIFASPITLFEWIAGVLSFIILLSVILISFLLLAIKLFYSVSILYLFKNFIIFAPFLFFSGIVIGFLILSILIYFGMRAAEIAYVIIWSFMPFSGVFYPVESLPAWAQKISSVLPMSYIFTGMRAYVLQNVNPIPYIIKSSILILIYGILFLFLFFYMFNKSKNKGLNRLTD